MAHALRSYLWRRRWREEHGRVVVVHTNLVTWETRGYRPRTYVEAEPTISSNQSMPRHCQVCKHLVPKTTRKLPF
jgi:hypothetical protein